MVTVVLVGAPNVGKSVVFNQLTKLYATVSNYPGTTVDVLRGRCQIKGKTYEIIDTPGMYSFTPFTEEERVTRQLLYEAEKSSIIHVIDTKNIRRMLHMTLQLMDAGFPVLLNLNVMDEAQKAGIFVNTELLSELLGIPVVPTVAAAGKGIQQLKSELCQYQYRPSSVFHFSEDIEAVIDEISSKLYMKYKISARMAALLIMARDPEMLNIIKTTEPDCNEIMDSVNTLAKNYQNDMNYVLTMQRQDIIDTILDRVVSYRRLGRKGILEKVGRWTREPLTGFPILCLVVYLGLYQVVGRFGAGFLVDFLDAAVFGQYIAPCVSYLVAMYIPWEWLQSLINGEYGLLTLGLRYAAVIIMPIVGTFFFIFALLEDCGYLPRLAMLVDRIFMYFGLNGRAIIPVALGLGCGTTAVMATRTLETKRERILATFLLALTVPCSAQLGVILALLSHNSTILAIWCGYIVLLFCLIGWLSAHILPGGRSGFYMEIPPMRLPLFTNVVTKACTRMIWYFNEILPVFILTSIVMWAAEQSEMLLLFTRLLQPFLGKFDLPADTAQIFIFGFFRRDYGAAGLYDLTANGLLTDNQLLVTAVILTLFVPCIAQLAIIVKERGWVTAAAMIVVIAGIAFSAGYFLKYFLVYFNILL